MSHRKKVEKPGLIRRCAKMLALSGLVLVSCVVILSVFRIQIPIHAFRSPIESSIRDASGYEVAIAGDSHLILGLWPQVSFSDVSIGSVSLPDTVVDVEIDSLSASASLVQLIKRRVQLGEVNVEGVDLAFAETEVEAKIRKLPRTSGSPPVSVPEIGGEKKEKKPVKALQFVGIKHFSAKNIQLSSEDPNLPQLELTNIEATLPAAEPMKLSFEGLLGEREKISLSLEGGSLQDLSQSSPSWKFSVDIACGEFAGQMDGELSPLSGELVDATVALETSSVAGLSSIAGWKPLTDFNFELRSNVSFSDSNLRLSELRGQVSYADIDGDISVSFTDEIPTAAGSLAISALDSNIFGFEEVKNENSTAVDFDVAPSHQASIPGTPEARVAATDSLPATNDALLPIDGAIQLEIDQIDNLPFDLEQLNAEIDLKKLDALCSVHFAGIPVRGTLDYQQNKKGKHEIRIEGESEGAQIDALAATILNDDALIGSVGAMSIELVTEADQFDELFWKDYRIDFNGTNGELAYTLDEDSDLEFSVENAEIFYGTGDDEPLRITGNAMMSGETFHVRYLVEDEEHASSNGMPSVLLEASSGSNELRFEGYPSEVPESTDSPEGRISIDGDRSGFLSRWVPISAQSTLPYSAKGDLFIEENGWSFRGIRGILGATQLADGLIRLEKGKSEKDSERPEYSAALSFLQMDPNELALAFTQMPDENGVRDKLAMERDDSVGSGTASIANSVPTVAGTDPMGAGDGDALTLDLNVQVGELILADMDLRNIELQTPIRGSKIENAPLRFQVGDTQFEGNVANVTIAENPSFSATVSADQVDLDQLMENLGMSSELEASASNLNLDVSVGIENGVEQSIGGVQFSLSMNDGYCKIGDQEPEQIVFTTCRLSGSSNVATDIFLDANFNDVPIEISLATNSLESILNDESDMVFDLSGKIAGMATYFKGEANVDGTASWLSGSLRMEGDELSTLNELVDIDFPSIGPVLFQGGIEASEAGFSVSNAQVNVGSTTLTADLSVRNSGDRPDVDLQLYSERLQIDDFVVKNWSPMEEPETVGKSATEVAPPSDAKPAIKRQEIAKSDSDELRELLGEELLASMNCRIEINVVEVMSGVDRLGGGQGEIVLQDSMLMVPAARIELPEGAIRASAKFSQNVDEVFLFTKLNVEEFDLGVLARRQSLYSDTTGEMDVDLELSSIVPVGENLMSNANGYMNFNLRPDNMDAGLFDIWADELLLALVPVLDPLSASKLNCVVGEVVVDDGLMTPKELQIDTTRVRVNGTGKIDFKNERIDLEFKPKAKLRTFLSLESPVGVKGSFDTVDADVGGAAGLITTAGTSYARMILSPVRWLFHRKLPADGSDICECDERS